MKPITHGMPNARHIRRSRIEREKLMAAGWKCHEDPRHPGSEFWQHPDRPDHTYTRRAAVKLQAAWDAKRKAEVA